MHAGSKEEMSWNMPLYVQFVSLMLWSSVPWAFLSRILREKRISQKLLKRPQDECPPHFRNLCLVLSSLWAFQAPSSFGCMLVQIRWSSWFSIAWVKYSRISLWIQLSSRAGSLDFNHERPAALRFFSEQRLSITSDLIHFVTCISIQNVTG